MPAPLLTLPDDVRSDNECDCESRSTDSAAPNQDSRSCWRRMGPARHSTYLQEVGRAGVWRKS